MTTKKTSSLFAWTMWLIAAVFYAIDYFQHTAPSVLIGPIAKNLHSNISDVGTVMSFYFPIYAISQIPAGVLLDKYGVKIVLSITCLVVSIGFYVMCLPSELALIAGRVLVAMGSAFAFLGALKTSSAWLPKSVFPIAVGLVNTVGVIGGMLGQPFLNHLIDQLGWQTAVLIITLFGIAWSVIILLFLRTPKQAGHLIEHHKIHWHILRDKNIWLLAIYAGIMVGTVVSAFSELYDVVFLQSSFAISAERAAVISSMIFAGIAIGGPSHGFIARFFTYQKTWMLISVACTIIFFMLIVCAQWLSFSYLTLYPLYFLTGFFVSSMLLSFSVARCCYAQDSHATIFALINMVISLCGFIFQAGLSQLLKFFQHGATGIPSPAVFTHSLWIISAFLFISLLFCLKTRRV